MGLISHYINKIIISKHLWGPCTSVATEVNTLNPLQTWVIGKGEEETYYQILYLIPIFNSLILIFN